MATKEAYAAYGPCEACGTPVLSGETATGTRVVLDPHIRPYTVLWDTGAPLPLLQESRGYPVHQCTASQQSCPARVELRDRTRTLPLVTNTKEP